MDFRRKLDRGARAALDESPDATLEVLVQVLGLVEGARAELAREGLSVHSASGPVVTGVIRAGDLRGLVALECVRRVEVSRTLHPEAGR